MKIILSILLAATLCPFSTIKANAVTSNNADNDGKPLRSYVLDDKMECSYIYNANNNLKKIVFKIDGIIDFTESYKYKDDKIIESFKQKSDGSSTTKKQYEYKNNLIVKEIVHINGELFETRHFKYNNDHFLKKIIIKKNYGIKEYTKTTSIEKLAENKIKVKTTNLATHIVTFDKTLTPQCSIPGYQPIVRINNNGIIGNILLLEVYPGENCTTRVESDHKLDNNSKTVLNSTITFKHKNEVNTQRFKYSY